MSVAISPSPGQPHRGGREGDDAFAAAGEPHLLAGGGLDRHALLRHAGNLGDPRAHGVAMRADARRLADHRDVEMRDQPAAGAHALDRERQEAIGGGAAPLRIAGREVHADVAVRDRAEDRVHQAVQHDVGVGMPGDAARVRDFHAAEPDMIAGDELVNVGAEPGADIAEVGQVCGFCAQEILRRGELHVAGFAGEGRDRHPGPFGERGVVGEIVARGLQRAPVRVDDRGKSEGLRRLHRAQQRAVERAGDESLARRRS